MIEDKQYTDVEIDIHELKEEMTILEYTRFGSRYRTMDQRTRDFIQHNFKKTDIAVSRNGKTLKIPVDDLQIGDSLRKIHNFPPSLKKLTVVNNKLIKALKSRGILRFLVRKKVELSKDSKRDLQEIIQLVELSTKRPSKKEEKRQNAVRETNELIQKVNESVNVRREASKSVEYLMDNARRGHKDLGDVENYVNNITKHSSADAIAAIASLKASDQTYSHCVDVGAIFQTTYCDILRETGKNSVFHTPNQAMLSAFLHDFGKSKIPKDILDSTIRFGRESREMEIMKNHPVYGAELLTGMNMPNSTINMAHFHHVKHDPSMLSSYPTNIKYKDVLFETRLLSIIDVYQALVGKRRYKRSWSAPATMRYIDALSGVEYDVKVWELFLKTMGLYPRGSIVELSNKSLGFVVGIPKDGEDPERPLVVVVRNEYGEDLDNHDLVDLRVELDLSIVKDIDGREAFGNKALEAFMKIDIS